VLAGTSGRLSRRDVPGARARVPARPAASPPRGASGTCISGLDRAPTPGPARLARQGHPWPACADTPADTRRQAPTGAPTPADTPPTGADTATRRPRKLTPRQQRALRDKRQRGVAIEALMEEYGISKPTVFRYLRSPKRGS